MEIGEAEIGMDVYYVPAHARGDILHPDVERGTVTSKSAEYVFVRFRKGTHGLACRPENLIKVRK